MLIQVKCNHCGSINKVDVKDEVSCECCGKTIKIKESKIINEENSFNHNLYLLKNAVYNDDYDREKYIAYLLSKQDDSNRLCVYFQLDSIDARIAYLNSLESYDYDKDIDQIIKYDIIFNNNVNKENKMKVINSVKDPVYKDKYLRYLNGTDENPKLAKDLIEAKIEQVVIKKEEKQKSIIQYIFLAAGLVSLLLTILLINLLYTGSQGYAVYIIFTSLPSVLIMLGLNYIYKEKTKNIYAILLLDILSLFLVFYILSYVLTIKYHEGSFFESLINHFKHIGTCLFDMASEVGSKWEGENDTL